MVKASTPARDALHESDSPERGRTLALWVAEHARHKPDAPAFISGAEVLTWERYHGVSHALAALLVDLELARGEKVAVLLPDGADMHIALLAVEKAGLVALGIGPRAGRKEVEHLIRVAGATALISLDSHRDIDTAALIVSLRNEGIALRHHIVVDGPLPLGKLRVDGDALDLALTPETREEARREMLFAQRRHSLDELFLLNSTSGTTGMPKCVAHHQNRWIHYHDLVLDSAGGMSSDEVFLSAIPATFGFGIWTSHFTPTLLGAPTVLLPKFSAEALIEAVASHRVTVMAAVSTQFIMMLNSPLLKQRDVGSLRILYTGGEAVPYERAAEFEQTTGASVLQFYGSNETGALSYTSVRDTREKRLTTAGRVIESMSVRLLDDEGADVTASGRGQPACRGAVTSLGYYNDERATQGLYSADGWMLTGDIAELDAEGYLKIVGRKADFIIRGGKNISGPAVEQAVATHPRVAMAAAVAMPDPVFGERVCVYVTLRDGTSIELSDLASHLQQQGYSKEYFPERVIVVDELPYASGGKVAKQQLREDIRRRISAGD